MTLASRMPAITNTATSVLDALVYRAEISTSAGGADQGGLSPSQIIAEAEEHWNVSGSSVLVAWLATFIGSVSLPHSTPANVY
jgi:hypothetical protein